MRRTYARGEPAVEELAVAGLPVPVRLRRHPSARRMTLRVSQSNGGVILTMPNDCRHGEAGRFVSKHVDWLKRHLDDLPAMVAFEHGAMIPFRGEEYSLDFVGPGHRGGVVWVAPAQTDLFAAVASSANEETVEAEAQQLCVAGQIEHAPRRLRDWLVTQARADLAKHVAWHAGNLDLTPKRMTVRDQTSRWGSCSSTGSLSFSWRLIFAPPSVLEYVAAHEVAHLREMNHSQRFWNLVRKTMPDMDDAKDWLHNNGARLHSYGH